MDDADEQPGRYRTLVETVGDPMYMLDADGRVTMANGALATTLGYDDPSDVEGVHVRTFVADEALRRGRQLLRELVATGGSWERFELTVQPVDGEPFQAEGTVAPLTDDGDLAGSVGVLRDVSDRKAREAELRALNDKIERLQSLFTDLYGATTAEEVYDLAIKAAVDIVGLDWCTIAMAEDGWLELKAVSADAPVDVGDRHLRVDEGSAGRAYQTGEPDIVRDAESESKGKPAADAIRSGMTVPIGDRGVFQATAGEPDAFDGNDLELAELLAGHVTEALARVERERDLRDLTDKVEQLHQATTALQSCTEPADIYDIVLDAAENILAFDWSVVAVATEGWLELAAVSDDAPISAGGRHLRVDEGVAGDVYQSGESVIISTPADHPDSDPVDDSFTANITVPLGDHGVFQANAEPAGHFDREDLELAELLAAHAGEALGRVEREQQLRERERELTRQNERLDRFASVVSHDLRNPLNVAQGHADFLDGEDGREIRAALDRMDTIIADVLELARQGRTIDDTGPVALADAVWDAWNNVDTGSATLQVETAATVVADRNRLVRLLENLFRNAAEYATTACGDDLAVVVGSDRETAFYVEDDGSGIPAAEREAVLEMGHTSSEDGTGFGLTIVSEIAAAHGWEVTVSEGRAGGARFEFTGVERVPDGS